MKAAATSKLKKRKQQRFGSRFIKNVLFPPELGTTTLYHGLFRIKRLVTRKKKKKRNCFTLFYMLYFIFYFIITVLGIFSGAMRNKIMSTYRVALPLLHS